MYKNKPLKDFYKILSISRKADDLEIKKARHDEMVGKTKRQTIDITPNDILELK
jgi:hypothetical protein